MLDNFCEMGHLSLEFITETPMITSNRLYEIVGGKTPHVFKTKEASDFQQEIILRVKSYLNKNKICPEDVLYGLKAYNMDVQIFKRRSGWFHKNGNLKRIDLTNIMKIVEDAVIRSLNVEEYNSATQKIECSYKNIDDCQCINSYLHKCIDDNLDEEDFTRFIIKMELFN